MSAAPEGQRPLASRAFDTAVTASGLVVTLMACALAVSELGSATELAVVLAAPVIALMSRFPLMLDRRSGGIEVGFDSAVLVFLAVIVHGWAALAAWCIGVWIAQLPRRKRVDVRFFNASLGCISGAVAYLVMLEVSPLDHTSQRELVAVGLGCAVYFVADYAISGISIALEERRPVAEALRQGSALVALGVFVAIDTLGYLAALVVRGLPGWSTSLLAVPVLTILVATRALASGNEQERRLAALFDAAKAAQTVDSHEGVLELLREHACTVALSEPATLRVEAPGAKEVGARLRTRDGEQWLVLPRPNRAHSSVEADTQALQTLTKLGEEALARITLVEEMGRLARSDTLTGLPNRAVFQDRVEHAVAIGRRGQLDLAVLFLDLDGFKGVNDRFGHEAGDQLLAVMAERLTAELREGDTVARLGGDEFAILVEQAGDVMAVQAMCRRLLETIRVDVPIQGHDVVVGASIGVAIAAPDDDADSLLRNADMAMYRAKAEGKGRFALYQPALREANLRRLDLIESLRRGIARDLVVHYQPLVDLDDMRVHGVEALVRWKRDGELVGPDDFIGAAEESGLIDEIGERVLDQVLADAPLLMAAAEGPLEFAVNVSAHQLQGGELLAQVRAARAALGSASLVLEMTERVVIGDDEYTANMLRALADTGAKLALDDFGVGFSSIGYLQHLPVHILKIDRSFTARIDTDRRAAALVEAMVVMGQALDLDMVAEGVERHSQILALQRLGCRIAQGFLFARPGPREQVIPLLRPGAMARLMAVDLVRAGD